MLSSMNPREVLDDLDDVFYLCVRLHAAAGRVADLRVNVNSTFFISFGVEIPKVNQGIILDKDGVKYMPASRSRSPP